MDRYIEKIINCSFYLSDTAFWALFSMFFHIPAIYEAVEG